jgi:hypothetical protein
MTAALTEWPRARSACLLSSVNIVALTSSGIKCCCDWYCHCVVVVINVLSVRVVFTVSQCSAKVYS